MSNCNSLNEAMNIYEKTGSIAGLVDLIHGTANLCRMKDEIIARLMSENSELSIELGRWQTKFYRLENIQK